MWNPMGSALVLALSVNWRQADHCGGKAANQNVQGAQLDEENILTLSDSRCEISHAVNDRLK
jgi:hypothetical protein